MLQLQMRVSSFFRPLFASSVFNRPSWSHQIGECPCNDQRMYIVKPEGPDRYLFCENFEFYEPIEKIHAILVELEVLHLQSFYERFSREIVMHAFLPFLLSRRTTKEKRRGLTAAR